jgi:hypothetical protein
MRVRIRGEKTRHIEGNITRNPNETSNRIPTTISLTLRAITKEDTRPTMLIAFSSHEAGEEQRQHNQRNEGGYTATADQSDAQVE